MVSAKKAAESEFLTADFIRDNKEVIAEIKDEGGYVEKQFGSETKEKLELDFSVNGSIKKWCPNMRCAAAMASVWGEDTINWVGKKVKN